MRNGLVVYIPPPLSSPTTTTPPVRGVVRGGERGVARVAPKPLELQLSVDQGASYSVDLMTVLEASELRYTSAFLTVVVVDTKGD